MSMQEAPDAPVWRVADGVDAMFPAHQVGCDGSIKQALPGNIQIFGNK